MELVGMEIRKNFQGFGVFTGTVQSYDAAAGYFKIQYEDGDYEEVDFEEIRSILKEMGGSSPKLEHHARRSNRGRRPKKRRRLDADPSVKPGTIINFESDCKNSELDETLVDERAGLLKENEHFNVPEEIQVNGGCNVDGRRRKRPRLSGKDKSTPETPLRRSARRALSAAKCENLLVSQDDDLGGGKESALGPQDLSKLELPPSSNDLDLDGLNVFDLFSVYTCLRSFSRLLFLSPFRLETFVAALRCKYANFLIDYLHFSILQALKPHLEALSGEGAQSASECLGYLNWELLDLVTWPVFLVHYLRIHGSGMKPGFRLSQLKLLDSEYYKQPAGVKLEILRCLCDDVIEVDAIRSELNRRMDSEINIDAACINLNIEKRRSSVSIDPSAEEGIEEVDDGNIDECCLCGMDGSLICCDGCPAAFHSRCVGVAKDLLPEGDWYCPECLVEKSDGLKKLSKPSRGAELLGFDPHGRLYFGSCDRLLVSDSWESDASYHCYNKNDLRDVISVLNSCYAYSVIVNAISMYWGFPIDASPSSTQYGNAILDDKKEDLEAQVHTEPPLPSKHDVLSDGYAESLAVGDSASAEQCGPKSSQVSDLVHLNSVISHELVGRSCPFSCSESCDEIVHAAACIQPSQQTGTDLPMGYIASPVQDISLSHADLTAASEKHICFPGWSCITDRKKPEPSDLQSDPDNYINYYSFGRIASSISAELMHKSSGETSIVSTMSVDDIKSAQLKAISNRISKDCCYAYQKLSMDVQKENCGWCFSCRTSSDFDCLFKVASDKNLKGSKGKGLKGYNDKDLENFKSQAAGPHSETNKKSHITYVMHHILLIEARARSLLSGPWEKPHYSQHWRKAVMRAPDVASLKPLLLALELNLRRVALSVEWSKPVDDGHAIVSASIVTSPVRGSSSYVGSRKLGKKNNSGDEFSFMSRRATNTISDIYWWRGGRLSRQLFQCKMLPRALASKGGRQAGCRKIPHMLYPDSSDFANRSKYVSWRVAVEMSQSVAQLTYQAKDFDSNIKWAELFDTRLFPKLAKETKKKAKSMKKVHICGRCKEGKQVKYLLDVSKTQTIPAIVMKHGVLLEESTTGRKRYWLSEAHVPLNLLKSYEEKKMKKRVARLLKKTDSGKHHAKESKCKTNKRKRSEWLSYLVSKEQKSAKQLCGHCNKDVPLREAVNCQFCGGFFHRKHFRVPKGAVGTTYTCGRCRETKDEDTKTVKAKDKDTKNVKAKAKDRDKKNAKAKEEVMESVNLTDREVSSVYVKAKGRKSVKAKEKNNKSTIVRNVRNKNKKSIIVEEKCRRSERVKQKYIRSLKVTARGHKTVSKRIKVSEGKKLEAMPKKGKHVFMTSTKKFTGHTRRMKGKSKNVKSENSENGISFCKRKRSVVHHSYWLNGLLWTHKPITEQQRDFRERNIILALQDTDPTMKPLCCLCRKEYSSGVIYIVCECCQDWFHGDAFDLTVENIANLIGFRCHKCLKRSEPVCPFWKSAAIGDADLFSDCGIGANVACNDHQTDEEKHCGSYIVCKEDHLDGEQREEAFVEHKKDEEKDHGSVHEDRLAAIHSEDHLDELHSENVIEEELGLSFEAILTNGYNKGLQQRNDLEKSHDNDHQNDETKHSGSSIVCKEDHFDYEQREEACVEHQKDKEKDHGCLHEDCWVTVHNEDHLDEQHRENVTEEELGLSSEAILTNGYIGVFQQRNHLENSHGNDHQNDEDKHCGSSVDCKEDHLGGEQRDKTCVEHKKDEEKGHGSLREDCLATGHNEDHLDGLHRENTEEELDLSSEPLLTNGYIGDLEHRNDSEKSHGGACEDCSSIVQSQDGMNMEQREDVILREEEPSLCLKTVSENVDYVQSHQQVETNVAYANTENEIEVGLTLNGVVEGLYRMSKIPDSGSLVVGTHSDSVVLDPEITRPVPDFNDGDADKS